MSKRRKTTLAAVKKKQLASCGGVFFSGVEDIEVGATIGGVIGVPLPTTWADTVALGKTELLVWWAGYSQYLSP